MQFPMALKPGAVVLSAILSLTPYEAGIAPAAATVSALTVYAGDLVTDQHAAGVLSSLNWTFGGDWEPDTVAAPTRVDIAQLVRAVLERDSYAIGDRLTLKIASASAGLRTAHSYDGDPTKSATLELCYYSGSYTGIARAVEDLVANSATFQRVTGAANAAEARARIFHGGLPKTWTPPVCLIHALSDVRRTRLGIGVWQPSGSATLTFFGLADDSSIEADGDVHDFSGAVGDAADWIGAVADEIAALGQNPGYLVVRNVSIDEVWTESTERRVQALADERDIDAAQTLRIAFGVE